MRSAALLTTALLAACSSPPDAAVPGVESPNPKAPDVVFADGEVYVKNPAVELRREYWIVFRLRDGRHAMFPRPDGAPAIAAECAAGSALGERFRKNALCQPASSDEEVRRINSMTAEDAMETSTFLHDRLKFQREGSAITPFPYTSDVLAVCRAFPDLAATALEPRCRDEIQAAERGGRRPAIFRQWTEAELGALPDALNRLHGVPSR
jgi:hypothetical protein